MFDIKTHLMFNENDNEICGHTNPLLKLLNYIYVKGKQEAETTFKRFKNQAVYLPTIGKSYEEVIERVLS